VDTDKPSELFFWWLSRTAIDQEFGLSKSDISSLRRVATRSQTVEAQHPRAIGLGVIARLGVAAVLQIL
jgi:hypothetical protein